jgi:hypothetical protein
MTEITASLALKENPRIFIPNKNDNCPPNRFFISRYDSLLLMCSQCNGYVGIVYHVLLGESMLPMMNPCKCHEKEKKQG